MKADTCLNPRQCRWEEVQNLLPTLQILLCKHDVDGAYVYGSVVQEHTSSLSDLDIAVVSPPNQHAHWFDYYNTLHSDLCQLFQADNIDLVLFDQAPLSVQSQIVLHGICIINGQTTKNLQEQVLARYGDMASWRAENWAITRKLVHMGIVSEVAMVNKERIERFVFMIRDSVSELQELNLKTMSLDAYRSDKQLRVFSEHYIRIAIESTLDLARHVIVQTGLGMPQEYREIGQILREKRIVAPELGQYIESMAGMRNILVHRYWDIDYSLIYQAIVEQLDTFDACIKALFDYVDTVESSS